MVTVADHHGEHIVSLSNDPHLAEENARRTVVRQRRVAPKRKVTEQI